MKQQLKIWSGFMTIIVGLMVSWVVGGQATMQVVQGATTEVSEPFGSAIVGNPQATPQAADSPLNYRADLTAQNSQGVATSQSTDFSHSGALIDDSATNLTANFTITNTSDQSQYAYVYFGLPKSQEVASTTTHVRVAANVSTSTFTNSVPSSLAVSYAVNGIQTTDYDALLQAHPDFQWPDLTAIGVYGDMPANSSCTIKVPLTVSQPDLSHITGVEFLTINGFNISNNTSSSRQLPFRFVEQLPAISGQYLAVTAQVLGKKYQQAPAEIQALMPDVGREVSYHNFYDLTGPGNDHFYTGGTLLVDLTQTKIAETVASHGYSVLLNSDHTPQTSYSYVNRGKDGPDISMADGSSSSTDQAQYAPYAYITLRQVLAVKNSTMQVGGRWTAANNFVSGLDDDDQPLTVQQVTTTITDPQGVLQNQVAVKPGTFKVTYAYQVSPTSYQANQPYIITNTATVTVQPGPATKPTADPTHQSTPAQGNPTQSQPISSSASHSPSTQIGNTGQQASSQKAATNQTTQIDKRTIWIKTNAAKGSKSAAKHPAKKPLPQTSTIVEIWPVVLGLLLLGLAIRGLKSVAGRFRNC